MELRNPQEVTALRDVAYVICYGHFPCSDSDIGTVGPFSSNVGPAVNEPNSSSPLPSPCSTEDDVNPFSDNKDEIDGSLNPFGEDDSEDQNPFAGDDADRAQSQDLNPFGEDETDKSPTEDSNPFSEDAPDNPSGMEGKNLSAETPDQDSQKANISVEVKEVTATQEPVTQPSSEPATIQPLPQLLVNAQPPSCPPVDSSISTLSAKMITNVRNVSRTHAKEIIAEAFNLTKFDLNRLVQDTRRTMTSPQIELLLEDIRTEGLPVSSSPESYPVIFLRAKLGDHEHFTNFSSTSASNTIQQNFTLGIQNMYNDILVMEVWSANKLPEEPLSPQKLDLLGRIMTGSIRRKKSDKITKPVIMIDEPIKETAILDDDIEDDTPHDVSQKSQSPDGDLQQSLEQSNDNAKDTTVEMHNGITRNDDLNQSLDKSDSVSISSEISSDPFKTSTPRPRSSSFQHLEVTNDSTDSEKPLQKGKGLRSSFKLKSGLSKAFRRSNQNLSDSASTPGHSRRGSDTSSIQLEYGDNSSHGHINEDTLDSSKEIGRQPKLNREVSRSTLSLASITSLTRRKFSIKKTTQAMKRIGSTRGKKENSSSNSLNEGTQDHSSNLSNSHNESSDKTDSVDGTANGHASMSFSDMHEFNTSNSNTSLQIPKSSRPMREFKNLMRININKDGIKETSTKDNSPDLSPVKVKEPDNPPNIQGYLSSINKGHLQAEILASTEIPLKDIVGIWVKDAWLPMTLRTVKASEVGPAKDKSRSRNGRGKTQKPQVCEKNAKVLCRMHVRIVLPDPGSELLNSGYDTYSITYSKLINLHVQTIPDLTTYKGSVGQVGKIILQQLIFFSRVSKGHQNLAGWLVLSEKKPADSVLLYPILREVRSGLQNGEYTTTQKQKLSLSLSNWIRSVMSTEFEVLHSAFPACSEMLEPSRLENFLRCFKMIEEDGGLRILFEREMKLISFPSLTDQLKGALEKHAEIWIDALNREPVNQDGDTNSKAKDTKDTISSEDSKWLDDIKRAASLTSPIVDFLYIGVQTYQSIFMVEMSVDYLYWVIPKFITAALHLTNKTKYFTSAKIHKLPEGYDISLAAQSAWKVCSNLSDMNKIGVECKLPLYLIEQEYRTAFSTTILQWLSFSEILSLKEIENDIQQDEFMAVHPDKGYSQSALSMVDLLRAFMSRLRGLNWPGGVRPGVNTLTRFARHIIALVTEYKKKVIHAYNVRGGSTDKIPTQVCVVVRNVEHVCNEAKEYLEQLATWAKEESQVQEELSVDETTEGDELMPAGRNEKLQSIIDDTAEKLLQKCLPRLEELLTQGVSRESPDYVIEHLEAALRPIEDRLYFAEPLLYALWYRLLQHATCLKNKFNQGDWRKDLQRLQKVIAAAYTFLIDSQKVECQRLEESIKEYEKLNDELTLLGASSSGLIAQYYSERHSDQGKAESSTKEHHIVFYAAISRDGLKVHILQAPGNQRGVLVKARVEPEEWFPNVVPQKTRLIKDDKKAVFDEHLHFPEVANDGPAEEKEETNGIGGVLVFQLRTPRLFGGSIVHDEAIIPLAYVPRGDKDRLFTTQFRLPLTRPWSLSNYKPLETLKSRAHDKIATEFLKALHARWEGTEEASAGQDTLKVTSSFMRASSIRFSTRSAKRSTVNKTLSVK